MTDSNGSSDRSSSATHTRPDSGPVSGTRITPPGRLRRRNSPWRSVFITLGVLALAYSGASYYAGMRSESEIRRYVELPASPSDVRLRLDQHERGIWRSDGVITITSASDRSGSPTDASDTIVIEYQINHALMLNRLARVSWQARPAREVAAQMRGTLNPLPVLSGVGTLDWEGQFDSSLAMPAFKITSSEDARAEPGASAASQDTSAEVAFGAMQGSLRAQARELNLQMHWPTMSVRETDRAASGSATPGLTASGVTLEIAMSDRIQGEGMNRLHVAALQSDDLQMAEITLTGRSHIDQTMRLELDTQIGRLRSGMYSLDNVTLDGVISGMNLAAVRTLQQVWNQTAGLQQVSEDQADQWRLAMRELILDGLTLEIPEMAASTAFGKIRGQSVLTLDRVPPAQRGNPVEPIDFEGYVSSSGRLILQGQGISPTLTALGLLTGVLVRTPDGVMASYELQDDRLMLNGKRLPALPVLVIINRILNPLVVQSDGSILDRLLQDYIEGYKPQDPSNPPAETKPAPEVLPVPGAPDLHDKNV